MRQLLFKPILLLFSLSLLASASSGAYSSPRGRGLASQLGGTTGRVILIQLGSARYYIAASMPSRVQLDVVLPADSVEESRLRSSLGLPRTLGPLGSVQFKFGGTESRGQDSAVG